MPKLLTIVLMILLAALAVVIGEPAETSRAALAIVITVFAIGLSIPAALAVGLVLESSKDGHWSGNINPLLFLKVTSSLNILRHSK